MATQIRLRIDDNADLEAARGAAQDQGVAIQEISGEPTGGLDEQIEPVTAVLIGAGVVAGVKMVIDWWNRRKGGLVVDLRPEATDMFYRDRDIEFGYIATIPAEGGKVTVDVKDIPDSATTWVNEVISASFKTVTEAAEAAKKAVGADRVQASEVA